ncbi:MAG: hypothetical protein EBZ36_08395, partial [Acidobacteria bacterium]|nr:hypothetical protein [Acidobacteriota bacterium]
MWILFVLLTTSVIVSGQAQPQSFSGQWILDKERTKDLPATLESYALKVDQSGQELALEVTMVGELRAARGSRGAQGG